MGKLYSEISPELKSWIEKQKMFFVATAPLAADGHINCSPKGHDSFRILSSTQVAYQDLTGSGAETIAHVKENKRMVIMFCAYEGPPKITRLYGSGEVVVKGDGKFTEIEKYFNPDIGTRAYIVLNITHIQDSCGFGVPYYNFTGNRDTMTKWGEKKGQDGIAAYQKEKNSTSIDGLPGLI